MAQRLSARSISRSVQTGVLSENNADWRVLAVFERACNLVSPGGDLFALVLPEIGDGPLNIVLDGPSAGMAAIRPGMPARLQGAQLVIGGVSVRLDRASVWEPCPDWERLRAGRPLIEEGLDSLLGLARQRAPRGSLMDLLDRSQMAGTDSRNLPTCPEPAPLESPDAAFRLALDAALMLRAGWRTGDEAQAQAGATGLAGLGTGLTPAGDDFLAGVMLRAWLAHPHPHPRPWCQILLDGAAPRTTTLSAALLRAAARGECCASWHRLLSSLGGGQEGELAGAVEEVLALGHTSGADTLAGFLWLGGSDR